MGSPFGVLLLVLRKIITNIMNLGIGQPSSAYSYLEIKAIDAAVPILYIATGGSFFKCIRWFWQ
jgi:hypothetical protein